LEGLRPNWDFQIQQAVEKSLKAWLFCLDDDPPFIYSLTALFERIVDRGGDVDVFLPLEAFTAFAVQFRYDAEPEPMEMDRDYWRQQAQTLLDHVAMICAAS
jgi:HEPN domain-containing protein